jgi:hypothetical protein
MGSDPGGREFFSLTKVMGEDGAFGSSPSKSEKCADFCESEVTFLWGGGKEKEMMIDFQSQSVTQWMRVKWEGMMKYCVVTPTQAKTFYARIIPHSS